MEDNLNGESTMNPAPVGSLVPVVVSAIAGYFVTKVLIQGWTKIVLAIRAR